MEELTNTLAGVPGLRVIARTSAFAFRNREADVREIGRQLGVETVLEWYTKAFDAHEGILVIAIVDPVTALLRTDRRFAPLVARMRLPDAVESPHAPISL